MTLRSAVVLPFLIAIFSSDGRAEHPIEAIARSMRWTDSLRGYDVDLTIHQNRKSVVTGKLAELVRPENRNDGMFSEWVQKVRELKLNDGTFAVTSVYGGTTFKLSKGEEYHNEASTSRATIGNQKGASVIEWQDGKVRKGDLNCGEKNSPCDVIAREFEWSKIPLYFSPALFQLSHKNAGVFENSLELIEAAGPDDIHTEKSHIKNKAVTIFRIMIGDRKNSEPKNRRVLKITVSGDGIDKGLVLEIRDLIMKMDRMKEKYRSERQVAENIGSSVAIEWRLLDNGDKKTLVPVHWTLKDEKEVYSQTTMNITAKWRLEEPDSKSLSLESIEATRKEFQEDVDRVLGRKSITKKRDPDTAKGSKRREVSDKK